MGNPLLKNYNIDKAPFTQGGYRDLWDIYHGSRKDRQQDVCIFIHEKKNLDKYAKEEREEILNVLKKEAGALAKFKHPLVLSLVDPLLEDKTTLIFVTEPFNYTLSKFAESADTSKLELKLLILELCNVISFMHNDAKVIITSMIPESILITSNGKLKLSGMAFSVPDPPIGGAKYKLETAFPNAMPLLKFMAPEIIYDGKVNYQSDIFALGILIHYLFKLNANTQNSNDRDLIAVNSSRNTVDSYKSAYNSFDSRISQMRFEPEDNDMIIKATTKNIDFRPTINEIMELNWFNDPKLKAFKFIENLEQNDPTKNTEFLNKFSNILNIFELKIIEKRFLPSFLRALKNENLIVSILPIIFNICQIPAIKVDFEADVWPALKIVFALKQIPAAALYFILSKINFIAEKISNAEFSSNMLNIICKALDCGVAKIQSVVMENLAFIIKKIDSLAFKNQVFPRLVNIVLNTTSNSLKVTILKSFINVYSLLDQNIINESLLNTLEKIRKSDNTSEICVSLVKIYEEIAKVVSVESIANKIMPNLISILVNGNISKKSFEEIMNLIQKYLNRIKESREKDLNIDETKEKASNDAAQSNIFNTSSNIMGSSTNKSDGNELSFLDSFFGVNQKSNSQNIVPAPIFNNFNNDNNKGSDMDIITKSIEEVTMKSNDKPKSIFDGIEDKNKTQSNNKLFNSNQENKFKLNKPSNTQEKKSDLAGFNFDFNNNSNKGSGNNMTSFNFNAGANKPVNNNILDSLLNDLPQVNINNNNNPQNNNNNVFNNFGNSNNLVLGNSVSSQNKNIDLNDEYDLDFLKPSNNSNKPNSNNNLFNIGSNTQNNNVDNFDFSSFGNNKNQKSNPNMNSYNFNNNINSNNLGGIFANQQQNNMNNNLNMNMGNTNNTNNNSNNNLFSFTNNFGNSTNTQNNKGLNKNNKSDNLFDGLLNM